MYKCHIAQLLDNYRKCLSQIYVASSVIILNFVQYASLCQRKNGTQQHWMYVDSKGKTMQHTNAQIDEMDETKQKREKKEK